MPEATRAELLRVDAASDDAIVRKDTAALDRLLTADFRLITAEGSVVTKPQLLAGVADPQLQVDPFVTENVQVRVHGDIAFLTGEFRQTGCWKGTPFSTHCRYTDVYVRRSGSWCAMAAQATHITEPH